jgi:hypothetical protein
VYTGPVGEDIYEPPKTPNDPSRKFRYVYDEKEFEFSNQAHQKQDIDDSAEEEKQEEKNEEIVEQIVPEDDNISPEEFAEKLSAIKILEKPHSGKKDQGGNEKEILPEKSLIEPKKRTTNIRVKKDSVFVHPMQTRKGTRKIDDSSRIIRRSGYRSKKESSRNPTPEEGVQKGALKTKVTGLRKNPRINH